MHAVFHANLIILEFIVIMVDEELLIVHISSFLCYFITPKSKYLIHHFDPNTSMFALFLE